MKSKNLISLIAYFCCVVSPSILSFIPRQSLTVTSLEKVHAQDGIPITKGRVKHLRNFASKDLSSDSLEFFFKISDIAAISSSRIVISDDFNKKLRVLNSDDGREITSFGKEGKGPAEFLNIARVKSISTNKIAVIDNSLRRISVFSLNGELLKTMVLSNASDDIVFLPDSTYLISRYFLDHAFKPVEKFVEGDVAPLISMGSIIEPRDGMIKTFESYGVRANLYRFSYAGNMTKIVFITKNKIVYSQRHPYLLKFVDLDSGLEELFSIGVDFHTIANYEVLPESRGGKDGFVSRFYPSGKLLGIERVGNYIFAAIMSAKADIGYIDCYNLDGKIVKRLQMPEISRSEYQDYKAVAFAPNNYVYFLAEDRRDLINWIEKYSIDLN